jgi:hypothetical protein
MAIKVKDAAQSAAKFAQRGAAAASDYAAGVQAAGADWQNNTAASAETYNAAVQDSISRGAFAKGVQKAGGDKYARKASTTGAQRFPAGVRDAQGDWATNTQPFLDTIRNVTLPARRPKGDPANYARVQAVGDALRRRKLAG